MSNRSLVVGVCGYPYEGSDVPGWLCELPRKAMVWIAAGDDAWDLEFAEKQIEGGTDILVVRPGWPISRLNIGDLTITISGNNPAAELANFFR